MSCTYVLEIMPTSSPRDSAAYCSQSFTFTICEASRLELPDNDAANAQRKAVNLAILASCSSVKTQLAMSIRKIEQESQREEKDSRFHLI